MKKLVWIPILILLIVIFLACQKQNNEQLESLEKTQDEEVFPVAQEVEKKLLSAMDQLANGRVAEGAGLLLDVVLLTKPGEYMPEEFENRILSAKSQFLSGNYKNAVELVSESLLLIKPAQDTPGDKENPANAEQAPKKEKAFPVAEKIKNYILSAMDKFKEGNVKQGVILILEALLLFSPFFP